MKKEITDKKLITKILSQPVAPLFDEKRKLALFFSAKSGCTFAVKWFFFQIGFLEVAQFYSDWIHDFRIDVFYKSNQYKINLHRIVDENFTVIKLVRNPYYRSVSSYLHAIRYAYEDVCMSKFLKRDVGREQGFSFCEYVNYLEKVDLRKCNVHHKIQVHPSEMRKLVTPKYIVKLENSFDEFKKIEAEFNLLPCELGILTSSKHHTARLDETIDFCGDKQFNRTMNQKIFPATKCFYNEKLKQKIAKLYKIDFDFYQYDMNTIV